MPDIKIRVLVDDPELQSLITKLNEGEGTLNDLTAAKKKLNAAFKDTHLGTSQFDEYASALAVVNDKQRDVRIQTRAGHEAYFKAGLELRQLMLQTNLAGTAVGRFSNELGMNVLNAVQLKQALIPLGIQMTGFSIGVAAVLASLPILVEWFSKGSEATKKWQEEFVKLNDEWKEYILSSDRFSVQEKINLLGTNIEQHKSRIALLEHETQELEKQKKRWEELGIQQPLFLRKVEAVQVEIEKKNQEREFLLLKIAKLEDQQYTTRQQNVEKIGDLEIGKEEEISLVIFREREKRFQHYLDMQKKYESASPEVRRAAIEAGVLRPPKIELPTPRKQILEKVAGIPKESPFKQTLEDIEKSSSMTQVISDTLKSAGRNFGSMLVQALMHGKDIAESIKLTLLEAALQLAINIGFKAIRFQHGGIIPEPVVGRGMRSGNVYTFAERGPEYVSPSVSAARAAGRDATVRPVFIVRNELTARGLATYIESGNRVNAGRRY